MFGKTAKPENPYRVVVVEDDVDVVRRLLNAGFHREPSRNGKQTYCIFDLKPDTSNEEIVRLGAVLRELS